VTYSSGFTAFYVGALVITLAGCCTTLDRCPPGDALLFAPPTHFGSLVQCLEPGERVTRRDWEWVLDRPLTSHEMETPGHLGDGSDR